MPTVILRPSGAGATCTIPNEGADPCPDHWRNVDEVIADEVATYIADFGAAPQPYKRDTYAIPPLAAETAIIDRVTIYIRVYEGSPANNRYYRTSLRTHATFYDGTEIATDTTDTWVTHAQIWETNPHTGSGWTWEELADLQIGVGVQKQNAASPIVTQVWAVVDYTSYSIGSSPEILRPDGAGDLNQLYGAGWTQVDEDPADDETTVVWWGTNPATGSASDLYNIPNSNSSALGVVSKIIIWARCKGENYFFPFTGAAKMILKTGGIVYEGGYQGCPSEGVWYDFSEEWATNPNTGNPWTREEIDALQIGVWLSGSWLSGYKHETYCTQVFVEVYFTVASTAGGGLNPALLEVMSPNI